MKTKIGHARFDENRGIVNGQAGDQTKGEVCITDWYSRPWTFVLRAKDHRMREKIADAMTQICTNDNIGYDQKQRNGIIIEGEKVNWDFSKISTPIECDCSSAVSACLIAAGIFKATVFEYGNACTTSTLRKALAKTGQFFELVDTKYLKSSDYLVKGDILLYEGHHVAVNLENGWNISSGLFYPAYKGNSTTLYDAMQEMGIDPSPDHRALIAKANGIVNYTKSAEQNLEMFAKLKEGTLKKA